MKKQTTKKKNHYLLMDQITFHRKDQKNPIRSANCAGEEVAEGKPLEDGDPTARHRKRGPDVDGADEGRGVVPAEDEDEEASGAGGGDGVEVESSEDRGIG